LPAWRKLAPAKSEDAWIESLAFLGTRLAITSFPNGRAIRLEAFALSGKEAALLKAGFGGSIVEGKARAVPAARKPIRIRRKLTVVDSTKALRVFPSAIVIPAGMAFGTGEHATTASCLRLLCDASKALQGRDWSLLDLGTGSGILAIAAAKLGAARVEAWDFDRDAIRVARENVRVNAAAVTLKHGDVLARAPRGSWSILTANLYSEALIRGAGKMADAVKPGGRLILSGILREQEAACIRAFRKTGVRLEKRVRSGKWSALLWVKNC